MLRVVVRLSVAFCMITGAGLSARADPANLHRSGLDAVQAERWDDAVRILTQAINERQLSSADCPQSVAPCDSIFHARRIRSGDCRLDCSA